jgi:hypothetical protein
VTSRSLVAASVDLVQCRMSDAVDNSDSLTEVRYGRAPQLGQRSSLKAVHYQSIMQVEDDL